MQGYEDGKWRKKGQNAVQGEGKTTAYFRKKSRQAADITEDLAPEAHIS